MRLTRSQLRSIKNLLADTFALTDTWKASLDASKYKVTDRWMYADSQMRRDINAVTRHIARMVGSQDSWCNECMSRKCHQV